MEARAEAKHIRISSRKMKPIANMVRGKSLKDAQAILKFTPRKGAGLFLKVLNSAAANAENNHNMDVSSLYVKQIYANQATVMKRYRPAARGSAKRILKRNSHLGVVLAEKE